MNDSDPGATLHFPPGTNGSAAPGVPDQSKAPPGFFAVKCDGGTAYIRASKVTSFSPGGIVRQIGNTQHAELVPGTTHVSVEHCAALMVKITPDTAAELITRAMESDPQARAFEANIEAAHAKINALNKTGINIQNAQAALDKTLEELRSK